MSVGNLRRACRSRDSRHSADLENAKRIMPDSTRLSAGTQDYVGDPRNDSVLISVNGALTPRDEAKVSVFDSGFVLGDGVWEGLRLVDGRIAFLSRHLDRLWDGAKMLKIDIGLNREALKARLFEVIEANGMMDGVHIRLMVTRGVKRSPYQDPRRDARRRDRRHHSGVEAAHGVCQPFCSYDDARLSLVRMHLLERDAVVRVDSDRLACLIGSHSRCGLCLASHVVAENTVILVDAGLRLAETKRATGELELVRLTCFASCSHEALSSALDVAWRRRVCTVLSIAPCPDLLWW